MPNHTNEVSGLMIMGVAGGAIFPIIMGLVSDSFGQVAGIGILSVAFLYLLFIAFKMEKWKNLSKLPYKALFTA